MCAKSLLLLYFHVLFLKLVNSTLAHFVQIKFAYDFSACMIQNFCCVVSDIYTHIFRQGEGPGDSPPPSESGHQFYSGPGWTLLSA